MKKAILSLVFILPFILTTTAFAQTPAITNGLNYLISTQNPDGSWGNETSNTEILPSTVSVIETLQILNQTNSSNYLNAVSWLQLQGLETSDYLSPKLSDFKTTENTERDLKFFKTHIIPC
ncbi:MAG: hypothetical protein FJ241_12275, partial [Nitrospira sp.]|nr:hypothetical protein [Nitrospira sp.]